MKIECTKEKLLTAITQAERSVAKSLSLPILSNIVIEVGNKKLIIKATNLEIGVEIEVPAKVDGEKIFAINPAILNNLLHNLPREDKLEIVEADEAITVGTNKGVIVVKTSSAEDFPIIPKVSNGDSFTLPITSLVEGIRAVSYAAALSDIKPEIASVYIYTNDANLVFVATDSFRLAEKTITLDTPTHEPVHIILPLKNASEIARILTDYKTSENIIITTDKNQLSLSTEGLYITSRVIDGVYPDYRQIMPKSFITSATLNREDLISTLKLAGVLSDKFNRLTVDVGDDSVTITTKNNEVGESVLTIKTQTFSGKSTSMTINGRYFLDIFQSFNDPEVFLGFNEVTKPLYIKGASDNTFQALVMPSRV